MCATKGLWDCGLSDGSCALETQVYTFVKNAVGKMKAKAWKCVWGKLRKRGWGWYRLHLFLWLLDLICLLLFLLQKFMLFAIRSTLADTEHTDLVYNIPHNLPSSILLLAVWAAPWSESWCSIFDVWQNGYPSVPSQNIIKLM